MVGYISQGNTLNASDFTYRKGFKEFGDWFTMRVSFQASSMMQPLLDRVSVCNCLLFWGGGGGGCWILFSINDISEFYSKMGR